MHKELEYLYITANSFWGGIKGKKIIPRKRRAGYNKYNIRGGFVSIQIN